MKGLRQDMILVWGQVISSGAPEEICCLDEEKWENFSEVYDVEKEEQDR